MGTSRGPEHDIEQRPRHYHDNPDVASPESSSSLSGEQRDVIHNQTRDVDLSGPQTWQPRWLREALVRVPAPIKRASGAVVGWVKGPRPPRIYKIEPIFPAVQTFPLQLVDRYLPKSRHRVAALLLFYILWLTAFAAVLHHSAFADEIAGYGSPSRVTCLSRYWYVVPSLTSPASLTHVFQGFRQRLRTERRPVPPFRQQHLRFPLPGELQADADPQPVRRWRSRDQLQAPPDRRSG